MPPFEIAPGRNFYKLESVAFFIFGLLVVFLAWATTPPSHFPERSIVSVEEGSGLYSLAEELSLKGAIRSPFLFRSIAIMLGGERRMKAGQYYFEEPEGVFKVAWRVVTGNYEIESAKITIPEGFTVNKISALFGERFAFFDHQDFEETAPEGYLFPDTYFIPVTATATSTVKLLRDNFVRKIFNLMPSVEKTGKELDEIVILASILEGEAKTYADREIISGILWKRIKLGMPLQVDAAFVYINGKSTKDLTLDDLKIDSPYNTYLYPGLPPTPISNPGLESLKAAIHPTTTPYLYFLTADDGTMHYAKTFEEHVANKQKYIK